MKKQFKNILLTLTLVSVFISNIKADFIGIEAGYAVWMPTLKGSIDIASRKVDFSQDVKYENDYSSGFLWAYIDHPFPVFPNIKIQRVGLTLKQNDDKNKVTYEQIDAIAYYRLLDNWLNFDAGISGRYIGVLSSGVRSNIIEQKAKYSFVPMLYTKIRVDLPFSPVSIEAEALGLYIPNIIEISDIKVGIVVDLGFGLGAVGGYKIETVNLNTDDFKASVKIPNLYGGLYYHF